MLNNRQSILSNPDQTIPVSATFGTSLAAASIQIALARHVPNGADYHPGAFSHYPAGEHSQLHTYRHLQEFARGLSDHIHRHITPRIGGAYWDASNAAVRLSILLQGM